MLRVNVIKRFLHIAPFIGTAFLAGASPVLIVLLSIGILSNINVLLFAVPVGGVVVLLLARGYRYNDVKINKYFISNIIALIFVTFWVGFNLLFTSQNILVNRDPATYSVTAGWLSKHESLDIHQETWASDDNGVLSGSAGFSQPKKGWFIEPQGSHLTQSILGLIGRVVGSVRLLRFTPLIGGLAIYAFYGLSRNLLKPKYSIASMIALGLSLPMLYFSRDVYTEPLTMAFLFTGLSLLWQLPKYRSKYMIFIAGLILGCTILVRIDSWLIVCGVTLFMIPYLMISKENLKEKLSKIISLAYPIALVGVIGWLDITVLSGTYYHTQRRRYLAQIILFILILLLIAITSLIHYKLPAIKNIVTSLLTKRSASVVSLTLCLLLVGMLLLPLIYTGKSSSYSAVNDAVTTIYSNNSSYIGRNFFEYSLSWPAWYLGYHILLLAIAGVVLLSYKSITQKKLPYIMLILVTIIPTTLYVVRPSITPDQIWAIRRFLPVTIPMFLLLAFWFVQLIFKELKNRLMYFKIINYITIVLIIAPIAIISRPFISVRLNTQASLITGLCQSIPNNSAVLWLGLGRLEAVQSTRTYCNVSSAGYTRVVEKAPNGKVLKTNDSPSKAELSAISERIRSKNMMPIIAVFSDQAELLPKQDRKKLITVASAKWLQHQPTLIGVPQSVIGFDRSVSVGVINDDGSIDKYKTDN